MSAPRVCVVGAGCAGLSAASRLRQKGYAVTVLEKRARVGGKCYTRTLTVDGQTLAFDLGATVVAISFRNILRFGRAVGVKTRKPTPYEVIDEAGEITSFARRYWPRGRRLRLLGQLLRYLVHVRRFYGQHVSETGYRDNIPARYLVSFERYAQDHGMRELAAWFELPLIAWGYGDPAALPCWYVFGEIDFTGMLGLLATVTLGASSLVKVWDAGYGDLMERFAVHEDLDVRVGAEVLSISRDSEHGVTIQTTAGLERFDHLVISDPRVARVLRDPSEAEAAFLAELRYSPYATILCTIDRELSSKLVVESKLGETDAVKMIVAQHARSKVVVCYANVAFGRSEAEIEDIVTRDLGALGLGVAEIHEVASWPNYFPRFASYAGYKALLAAQGQQRTIYVGAINRFEFTESAAATATGMIDAYFADLQTPASERMTGIKNARHMFR